MAPKGFRFTQRPEAIVVLLEVGKYMALCYLVGVGN